MIRKVLVTGGTGFVGYWMSKTQPQEMRILDIGRDGYDKYWDEWEWDAVVHLAPVPPLEPIEYCLRHDTRLLLASSGAVYDRQTLYAHEKRAYEKACLAEDIDVVIARLFTFSGDRLDEDKAIFRFQKAASLGEPIVIWGDGTTVRSYMNGRQMGEWMWAILLKGKSGEAYDVGSDEPVTMLELAQNINRIYGNKSEIVFEDRPDECPYYMPKDTEKTRRLLESR